MSTTHAAMPTQVAESGEWKPVKLSSKDVTYATWIAFFAWVFAVYDFILFGTLLPIMGGHFSWSEAEQAEIATWVAVGGALVAFAIGPHVDRIGRRGGIMFTIGGTAICSALTAVCAGMGKVPVVLVRSVAGLGITGVLTRGGEWHSAALWFGALPCFLSGVVMPMARHVDPDNVKWSRSPLP